MKIFLRIARLYLFVFALVVSADVMAQVADTQSEKKAPAWLAADAEKKTLKERLTLDSSAPRIDASTQKTLNDSFSKVLLALDDERQQLFASAMATIGVIVAEEKSPDVQKKFYDIVHQKTADEIIAASRKLTPFLRKYSKIIDGTSADAFNRSLARTVVSLSPEKQQTFSESVAKLLYQAEKDGVPVEDLRKKLDGKTADEIIWLAETVNLPFKIDSDAKRQQKKEIKLTPLSPDELKKYNAKEAQEAKQRASAKKKHSNYKENLSPSSLF